MAFPSEADLLSKKEPYIYICAGIDVEFAQHFSATLNATPPIFNKIANSVWPVSRGTTSN